MGVILSYSLFSSIVLVLLYLAYKWMMAGENQHAFNRVALWGIYAVSLLAFPLMALWGENEVAVELTDADVFGLTDISDVSGVSVGEPLTEVASPMWPRVMLWIYLAGVVAMTSHTLLVGWRLWRVIRRGEEVEEVDGYSVVVTDDNGIAPFSWCRYVVMNRQDYETHGSLILVHELRHLGLGHWVDLLVAQMVGILQWYNPAAWLMREEMKTVHEYQADKAVLQSGINARDYQMLLVCKALGRRFPSLANCLNHSKLKKRITMMYDERTSAVRRLRGLILLPALAVALVVTDIDAVASVISETAVATFGDGTPEGLASDKEQDFAIADEIIPEVETEESDVPAEETAPVVSEAEVQETPTVEMSRQAEDLAETRPDHKEATIEATIEDVKAVDYASTADAGAEVHVQIASHVGTGSGDESAESAVGSTVSDSSYPPVEVVYSVTEEKPKFPGGDVALLKFVAEHLRYPSEAREKKIQGRVVIQFVVKADGGIGDVRVVRSLDPALDAEAVRVAKLLPAFSPGRINGRPVAVCYTLPVTFKLKGAEPKKPDVKTVVLDGKKLKEDKVEFYIDGVRIDDVENAIAMLDPSTIARIDVIKDPDRVFITLKPQAETKTSSTASRQIAAAGM